MLRAEEVSLGSGNHTPTSHINGAYGNLTQFARLSRKRIARQNDKISQISDLDSPKLIVITGGVRSSAGIALQRLLCRNVLLRNEHLPIQRSTGHRRMNPQERIERHYWPVTPERDMRPGIQQRPKRIARLAPLRPNRLFGITAIIRLVQRLHGGDNAEPCKSRNVIGKQVLCMLDS